MFADLVSAGDRPDLLRAALLRHDADDLALVALLRRAVPRRVLELMAAEAPWSDRPRLLGAVVLSPRATTALALRLLGSLFWSDLAEVARSPRLSPGVRARAEGLLKDQLPELRTGERSALARVATAPVLAVLLQDGEPLVLEAALLNGRLREEDVLSAVRAELVPVRLLEAIGACRRWTERYRVRRELVLQPRTPLALALAQLTSLRRADLLHVAAQAALRPLVQITAGRLAERLRDADPEA